MRDVLAGEEPDDAGLWAIDALLEVRRPARRRGRQLEARVKWAGDWPDDWQPVRPATSRQTGMSKDQIKRARQMEVAKYGEPSRTHTRRTNVAQQQRRDAAQHRWDVRLRPVRGPTAPSAAVPSDDSEDDGGADDAGMESDDSYEDGIYEPSSARARKRAAVSPRAGGRKRQRASGGSIARAVPDSTYSDLSGDLGSSSSAQRCAQGGTKRARGTCSGDECVDAVT